MFVKRGTEQFGINISSSLSGEDTADVIIVSVFLVEIIVSSNIFCNVFMLNKLVDNILIYFNRKFFVGVDKAA